MFQELTSFSRLGLTQVQIRRTGGGSLIFHRQKRIPGGLDAQQRTAAEVYTFPLGNASLRP